MRSLATLVFAASLMACSGGEPNEPNPMEDTGATDVLDAGDVDTGQDRVDFGVGEDVGVDGGDTGDTGDTDMDVTDMDMGVVDTGEKSPTGASVVSGAATVVSQRFSGRVAIGAATPTTRSQSPQYRAVFGPLMGR